MAIFIAGQTFAGNIVLFAFPCAQASLIRRHRVGTRVILLVRNSLYCDFVCNKDCAGH